jgi:hypothetical protein
MGGGRFEGANLHLTTMSDVHSRKMGDGRSQMGSKGVKGFRG